MASLSTLQSKQKQMGTFSQKLQKRKIFMRICQRDRQRLALSLRFMLSKNHLAISYEQRGRIVFHFSFFSPHLSHFPSMADVNRFFPRTGRQKAGVWLLSVLACASKCSSLSHTQTHMHTCMHTNVRLYTRIYVHPDTLINTQAHRHEDTQQVLGSELCARARTHTHGFELFWVMLTKKKCSDESK